MSSNKPTSTGNANGGGGGNFTEYKLKMSPMAVSHNVMVLNSSTAKLSDFTQPVRMFRDKNSALIQEAPAKAAQPEGFGKIAVGGGSINAPGSRPSFKKKTKIFFQGDEEEFDEQVRETEAVPWLLEDFDAQHSFVGKLEGGQSSNYVFFVNQGDEFRIIPVNKWYRFQSKLSYHTLSLDEAETQMAAKKKDDVSRWLMKNRPVQKASEEDVTVSEGPKLMKLAEKVLNDENEQRRRQAQIIRSKKEDAQRGEELDFDELFDDDEGNDNFGGLLDDLQPEDSNELATNKKSNYKLSNEGKAMKKIVRHLDKSNDIIYASDDENDPYASDYENDEDEDDFDKWSKESSSNSSTGGINSASVPSGSAAHVNKPKQPQPQSQGIKATSSTATSRASSLSVSPITSKSPSPPGSPNNKRPTTTTPSKRSKTSDDEESNNLISEIEIIGHLRQGPISTKDLIAKFKRQLKADPKNKEIFRELVRKLAMVKTFVGSGEEDKLLELKPEFK